MIDETKPPLALSRILVLEDVPVDAELVVRTLRREGLEFEWVRVETAEAFRAALDEFAPDAVIADYTLPHWDGMSALKVVRAERPDLPFVVVTGSLNEETAADCIKQGADDYVLKERLQRLPHALRAAAERRATAAAHRRAEEELRLRRSALEAVANGVVITELDGTILWVNPAFSEMTGFALEEVVGRNPRILKSGVQGEAFYKNIWSTIEAGRVWHGEIYNKRKDGRLYVEEMTITPILGPTGAVTRYVAVKTDVTERRRQEEAIRTLATRDLLTGLPNQAAFVEELEHAVTACRAGGTASLVMLDLDRFAVLNDAAGHPVGDRLIAVVADQIAVLLPPRASLFRFGGDQYTVILDGADLDEAEALAEALRAAVEKIRFEVDGAAYHVTTSAGVAPVSPAGRASEALALVDSALQEAKERGRNRVVALRAMPSGMYRMDEQSRWAVRVKEGLKAGSFRLLAQPVVSLSTGESAHAEVLLRFVDESGGLVSPGAFLPAAEKFGLMPAIDRWVVGQAIAITAADPGRKLFVNLSGASLGDGRLLEWIEESVTRSGIQPGALTFEITETAAIADVPGVQRWTRRLKELGCAFALDDFGTGFSSFAYLQALPVDVVKIDGSFIRDLDTNRTNQALVQAMVTVAHALGKSVVAEMVERPAVADVLRSYGVEFGQGWNWGRPAPIP